MLFSEEQLTAWERSVVAQTEDMVEEAAIEALQEATVTARQEVLTRETARSGGIAPLYQQVIDGRADAPLSAIQPYSTIVLLWNYLPEVATRTHEALEQRSPRRSGRYIESISVFLDQVPGELNQITYNTQQVMLVPSVPYARRLEVGKRQKDDKPFVRQVAPHIVEETAIVAKRKFSEFASFVYNYTDLANAWQLSLAGMTPRHWEGSYWRHGHTPRTRHGMLETHVRYPSITITKRE